jgi:hypothetical protein
MSNRINGDFNAETIEAFRSAYASQMLAPEDQEIDSRTGLPTNLVLNTSPWIQHTGLWKANDGTDKNFIPNQTLVPGSFEDTEDGEIDKLMGELLEEEAESGYYYDDDIEDIVSDLLEKIEEEGYYTDEEFEDILSGLREEEEDFYADEDFEDTYSGLREVTEEEIDAIIAEIEGELGE